VINRFAPLLQVTRGWAAPDAAEATAHAVALVDKSDNLARLVLQTVGSFAAVISRGTYPRRARSRVSFLTCLNARAVTPPLVSPMPVGLRPATAKET